MSDKNTYESMRDDVRAVSKNAVGCAVAVIVVIAVLVAMILKAILIVIIHLLFYAAIIVLLSIPLYVGLEVFYYRRFAHSKKVPTRYRRSHARSENLFRKTVESSILLERRIRQLSDSDQRRVIDELEALYAREERLRADIRRTATVEANWIRERLNVTQLRRLAVLRRVSILSAVQLNAALSALDDDLVAFEWRLQDLKAVYDVEPDPPGTWNARIPWVTYIRVALHSPLRLKRREISAPRVSLLFSEWPLLILVLMAAALSSVIVAAVFSAGLPRW
jgi:hypothetical protein